MATTVHRVGRGPSARGRKGLRGHGFRHFHCWVLEAKNYFVTFCLSSPGMARPGKARITINFPFQNAVQKRTLLFRTLAFCEKAYPSIQN